MHVCRVTCVADFNLCNYNVSTAQVLGTSLAYVCRLQFSLQSHYPSFSQVLSLHVKRLCVHDHPSLIVFNASPLQHSYTDHYPSVDNI